MKVLWKFFKNFQKNF